jgi:aminoglycoside phosphotransferase (APT) family kinase protein
LVGRGRSADIYDIGDGRVLRRNRGGRFSQAEVDAMRAAAAGGYPVPTVHSVDGADMVLDRVDGRDMLAVLASRPWRARRYGRLLADLHLRLRTVDAFTVDLATFEPPEALVHGDLHPGNVLLADGGAVVIDWEGARVGPADADTALAWLLTEVAEIDDVPRPVRPVLRLVRRTFVKALLGRTGRPRRATVDLVCSWRADDDPNMRAAEVVRIRAFARAHGTGGDAVERP